MLKKLNFRKYRKYAAQCVPIRCISTSKHISSKKKEFDFFRLFCHKGVWCRDPPVDSHVKLNTGFNGRKSGQNSIFFRFSFFVWYVLKNRLNSCWHDWNGRFRPFRHFTLFSMGIHTSCLISLNYTNCSWRNSLCATLSLCPNCPQNIRPIAPVAGICSCHRAL